MTCLCVPCEDFELTAPVTAEVAMRMRSIAELQRRLAEERNCLLHLLGCDAAQTTQRLTDAKEPKRAVQAELAAVTVDNHVAEGKRRLDAVGGINENTRRAYESALRGVDTWLREQRPGKALDDTALADYLAVLTTQGRSVSSAALVVAAVRWRAKQEGLPLPANETAVALRCYGRMACAGPGQVRGISWEEADQMGDLAARVGDARGRRDAALIAVGSDALLRVSEVSAIEVEDVTFEDDGSARLLVPRSKTDQRGRGALLFLGPRTATLIREWTEAAGIKTGALFRPIHRYGVVAPRRMGPASVRRVIVDRARAAGIRGRVSGHSLRVGCAQSLAKCGVGVVAMQKAGRWVSPDMPARYTRSQAAADGAVACFRYPQHLVTGAQKQEKPAREKSTENRADRKTV